MIALFVLFACNPEKDATTEESPVDDSAVSTDDSQVDDSATDDSSEPEEFSCGAGWLPEPSVPAIRLSAQVTWTLDFSEEGEANGLYDCSYARTYEGVQRLDVPFLCPDCALVVQGDATLTEGADCSALISSSGTVRTEMWGFADDGRLFRTTGPQYPLGELTTFEIPAEGAWADVGWDSVSELSAGGTMTLVAVGQLRWQTDAATLIAAYDEPHPGAYAAGWEQNDPGNLTLDFSPQIGDIFPNARFEDQCHDYVDLWDFYGSYLVIDNSQPDCGPCQNMAAGEADFVAGLQAEGIPVRVITLMGNGLSDSTSTPPASTVDGWASRFGVTEPILYDRGFGYAIFEPFLTEYGGESFGYPAWVLLDPEMRLIHGNIGFSNWGAVADVVRADWEAR